MKRAELYLKNMYEMIRVLAVWEYLKLIAEGGLKE